MSSNYLQNIFTYGTVGERLAGIRNSEVYSQGLKQITNMLVTDVGSLRVLKQYDRKNLGLNGTILDSKTTAHGYYIVLTSSNMYAINDSDNNIKQTISHSFGGNAKMSFIGNDKLVIFNGGARFASYNIGSTITSDSSFNTVKVPIKEREVLQLDLWKVTKNPFYTGNADKDPPGTKPLRIVQMSAFQDPLLKTNGGNIYLHNSDIRIDRVYTSYNAVVDIEYFTNPAEGQIYGIMRSLPKIEDGKTFVIDNTSVTLGAQTNDPAYKGNYFTAISGDGEGIFTFGKLIPNIIYPEHVSFYQDRMFIYKEGVFYVSKIGEYNDFRNGISADSPFFFQLNPIAGKTGRLIDTISDVGMYVLTTAGIYVIGFGGGQLTPTTFGGTITVASDVGATDKFCMKDNILYFINNQSVLKAVFVDRLSQQTAFNTITVDKYTNKKLYSDVTKITIDDRDYVGCRGVDGAHMYIIEPIESTGIFRKTRMELSFSGVNNFIGVDDKVLLDSTLLIPSNRNIKSARIEVNPFYMSSKGGMYLYDNSSTIRDVVVKCLNEDRQGILGVKIFNRPITNLPDSIPDLFNIYRASVSERVMNGFSIEIVTKENDKDVELQGIECSVTQVKDS